MNEGSALATVSALRWRVVRFLLVAGVAALVAGLIGGGSGWAAAGPSASSASASASFYALSCKGSSFCLATGNLSKPSHPFLPLLEEWNGRAWRIFPKPPAYDNNITCGGPSFCLAATLPPTSRPLAVVWNGRAWRAFKPQPPDPFHVTCSSPKFCVTFNNPGSPARILEWNGGKSWLPMPGARGSCAGPDCHFESLTCATATDCSVLGSYCTTTCEVTVSFSETWNGTAWNPTARTPFAGNEACAGRSFCMLLSLLNSSVMAAITNDWGHRWHGATANLASVCHRIAACGALNGLACGSPRSCMALASAYPATGSSAALAWNGATWKAVPVARVGGRIPDLTLPSCGSPRSCMAIGAYRRRPGGIALPIAEHWNGSAWQVTPVPIP